jgi:hypothetical protein
MRTDTKALLKIIGASVVVALVAMSLLVAAAVEAIPQRVAIGLTMAVLLVGAVAIGLVFGRGLLGHGPSDRDV